MSRPTLLDVARHAGVSRATAARVLAGADNVDDRMTAAVLRVAEELDYTTNAAARSLRSGRTRSVGLVIAINELDGLAGPFTAGPLKGATRALSTAQLQPVLLPADGGRDDRIAQYLSAGHVDGAIVILQHEISDIVDSLRSVKIPIVYVGRPVGDAAESGALFVDSDNYGGGRLAVRALLEAGRRTISTIAGPSDMQAAIDRLRGWRDELAAWGVPEGPVTHGDFTMQGGTAAMTRLLARAPGVDAVFAASDLMAVGALRVLQASGRSVPGDVSLIGFDDTLVAATAEPPLSSVRQPLEQMGRSAAQLLLELIDRPTEGRHEVLPTTLVTRESV